MFQVLIQFRPRDPTCQTFDRYLLFPETATYADIFNDAVDVLNDFYTGNNQSGDFRRRVCAPTEYTIEIGPTLGQLA